ncbi:MAG: hypothetical protein JNK89_09990 [Saprospiraceae bacterium]|nr:hypothetical protein [Saprospiraceae bacterium]
MPKLRTFLLLLTLAVLALGSQAPENSYPPGFSKMPPSPQRAGNPEAGYRYLLYGDMVSRGIPLEVYRRVARGTDADDLGRTGDNAGISFQYNVVEAPNGVKVVAPTCLTCHAEKINGQLIVGLGNTSTDHSYDQSANFRAADFAVQLRYGKNSPEWEAYYPLSRGYQAVGRHILTSVRGPNPADKIFAALAAHRRASDLRWIDNPQFTLPDEVVPTDVPAWWLLKKKYTLYYNGLGTGDFARLSSASGMLVMTDSAEARRIDAHMVDVLAWIRTLEPPAYPFSIDAELAAQGKVIFEKTCSTCHGTYGAHSSYPNYLIDIDVIGTDSLLMYGYGRYPEYADWYNNSWFAKGPHGAQLRPNRGYVAPPLDGVWATAPYLHNGSVPTIEDLLNSTQRPTYWRRLFDSSDYDPVRLGWNYTIEPYKTDADTYDTSLPGYSNSGHTFGDKLSAEERRAVLEYLKGI